MIQQWKVDQFGVAVAGSLDRYKDLVLDLAPDLVQIPLHLYQPSIECCEEVIKNGTKLIGKLILHKDLWTIPVERFDILFKRYKGLIKIWDFGGEPETAADQPGCRFSGTPAGFTNQVKAFYEIGKKIDPDNIIGGCGWISPTFNGYFGNEDRSLFLKQCLDFEITDYLDFISLNFYLYGYGGTKNILVGTSKVNELLARHRVNKPIVVSECGVPCAGDPAFYHIIQTPERQAISLVEQTVLFNSIGIDYSIWFALQYEGWGLADDQGGHRLSYSAFKTIVGFLKGSTYDRQIKALPSRTVKERWLTDKVQWHVFKQSDIEIHVIWITGGYSLRREWKVDFKAFDLYGKEIEKVSTAYIGPEGHNSPKGDTIIINGEPKYLIAQAGILHEMNFLLR